MASMTYSPWLSTHAAEPTVDYRAALEQVRDALAAAKQLADAALGDVPIPPVPPTPPVQSGRGPVTDEGGVVIVLNDANETLLDGVRDYTQAKGTILLKIGVDVWLLGLDGHWYWRNTVFQSWSDRGTEHP